MTTRKSKAIKENLAEAERRIARWDPSESDILDLNGLGLRRLPETLRALTPLEHLLVHTNELREIPDWIDELQN